MSASVTSASASSSDSSRVGAVNLKDGTVLPADVVVCGVGVGPATSYLKESKGAPSLQKDGSVEVNDSFEVEGLKDVYAIGDIATYPYHGSKVRIEHWNVAQNSGRTAAKRIATPSATPKPFIPIFWSALGAQLRYCGNTMVTGYDDVVIDGETDVQKGVSFAAYYTKGEEVVAVASMMKDPVVMKCAELMRRGDMLKKSDIKSGSGSVLEAKI